MKGILRVGLFVGIMLAGAIVVVEWGRLTKLFRDYPAQFSALVALCALLLSLCVAIVSINFTARALRLQREHNFKSVIPFAKIWIGDYQDNLEVKVCNVGIGPLLVERFTVSSTSAPNQKKSNVVDWMPEQPNEIYYSHFVRDLNGWCIAPNTEVMIFQLEGDSDDELFAAFRDAVRTSLSELVVTLEYKDIYDRKMPTQDKDFQWFGRHCATLRNLANR